MPWLTLQPRFERLTVQSLHRDKQVPLAFPFRGCQLDDWHQVFVADARGSLDVGNNPARCGLVFR